MIKNVSLKILDLNKSISVIEYKYCLAAIQVDNPFSCIELIAPELKGEEELFAFILKEDEMPLVIMPFIKKKINQTFSPLYYYDICSPYGYSGPFYNDSINVNYLFLFWNKIDEWYIKNNIVSEFIRFSLNSNYKCYTGNLHPTLLNVRGNLISLKDLRDSFKPKVRNNIRRAEQENLKFAIFYKNISRNILISFHNIYIDTMKRNKADKRYLFSLKYFEEFVFNNPDKSAIAIVFKDEIPISVELLLISSDTIYSHLGGTDINYFNVRPNDFLKYNVMSWALNNQKKYYILGGGLTNGDDLYKYKKRFFPLNEDLIYFTGRKVINKEILEKLNTIYQKHNPDDYNNNIKKDYFPLYSNLNLSLIESRR